MFFGQISTNIAGTDIGTNTTGIFDSGMKDATMESVAKRVANDPSFSKDAGLFNNLNAEYYMSVNILTRLIILYIMNEYCQKHYQRRITPKELLIAQLNGNIDIIESAMSNLCLLLPSPQSVQNMIAQMKMKLYEQQIIVRAVLDEAHLLEVFSYVYFAK